MTLGCQVWKSRSHDSRRKLRYLTPGLRVPGMALLGYRPFGPGPSRSAFPFRHVRHPSVHYSLATAVGNQHGSQGRRSGCSGCRSSAQPNAGPPAVAPGTTPPDPIRARCRSARINHRVARGIGRLVPVRGPLPHISMHIEKAPRVGGKLADTVCSESWLTTTSQL